MIIHFSILEIPAERNLLQTLLRDYNIDARPVHDPSQILVVSIDIAMRQLIDVVSPGAGSNPGRKSQLFYHWLAGSCAVGVKVK